VERLARFDLTVDDKQEAEKNSEGARLWINGLEAVKRKLIFPEWDGAHALFAFKDFDNIVFGKGSS
jgi:hypothetical protein